jgi:serine/threonine-protein kinase
MTDVPERLASALADRYRIERELGAGGMATVYLAHDPKHDRKVAVKVLRPELAAVLGAERFLNEIKVTANLHHPHILPLHDSGEAEGFLYYVMPFVEGESLRDRIAREKQLPVNEAVEIGTQVATALAHAHHRDVIHRDIKPGNILLQDGQAVVADFGIALAVTSAGGDRVTETGLSLGTPEYMSPEQATADRQVDARSDVYSLGAVIYEMLVGEPPHTGPTVQAVVTKVVTEETVPAAVRRPTVPANVDAALAQALAKLPADRFATAEQFAEALADRGFALLQSSAPSHTTSVRTWLTSRSIVLVSTFVVVAGGLGWLLGRWPAGKAEQGDPAASPVLRFTIDLPAGDTLAGGGPSVVISPDGSLLVWAAVRDGTRQLFRRDLTGLEVEPIPGTEDATAPFFSPTGEWIGFFAGGRLKKVAAAGGSPGDISAAPVGAASWGADDNVVIGPRVFDRLRRGLWRVPAAGGRVEQLNDERSMWPQHSPEGGGPLFYTSRSSEGEWQVSLFEGRSGENRALVEGGAQGRFVPTGHLVYAWNGSLLAASFNLGARERTGPPAPVVDGVWTDDSGAAHFSVSRNGRLVYAPGEVLQFPERKLVWVDRSGAVAPLPLPAGVYSGQRVSPDGEKVVLQIADLTSQLWTFDVERPVLRKLTDGSATEYWPTWDPTSRFVGHNSDRHGGPLALYVTPADGSGPAKQVSERESGAQTATSWRRDGRALAFQTYENPGTWGDIWVLSFDDSIPRPFLQSPATEFMGQFSPDGNWMAYVSDASGRWEVYVQPYPGPGGVVRVSLNGGTEPMWAPSGQELFYRDLSGRRVYSVSVDTDTDIRFSMPTQLFEGEFRSGGRFGRSYDVTPDGQRFLMLEQPPLPPKPTQLIVVDGWYHELERKFE